MLQEMRLAYRIGANVPTSGLTPGEQNAIEWLRSDPKGFRTYLVSLEKDWLARKTKLESMEPVTVAPVWDHKGPCPTCGHEEVRDLGTEHCVAVAEQWLRENAG